MKTIGLIGGVSWESSKTYYAYINRLTRDRLGGLNSAPMVLMSLNLADIEPLLSADDWQGVAEIVCAAGKRAEDAGAEALFIASNTLNRVQPELAAHVGIPCFHIARATGESLARDNRKKVGLIATRFTIEQGFHAEILAKEFNIETIVPDQQDIAALNQIILEELCLGIINDKSRTRYLAAMERLTARGAEAIILGCTEIEMLVKPEHTKIPLYDTTKIHATYAVDWALG